MDCFSFSFSGFIGFLNKDRKQPVSECEIGPVCSMSLRCLLSSPWEEFKLLLNQRSGQAKDKPFSLFWPKSLSLFKEWSLSSFFNSFFSDRGPLFFLDRFVLALLFPPLFLEEPAELLFDDRDDFPLASKLVSFSLSLTKSGLFWERSECGGSVYSVFTYVEQSHPHPHDYHLA